MPLCDWLCKCCCCTSPCTSSSSPTTPTSPNPQYRTNGQQRHRSQQQQEGHVVAHMHQQNNASIEVVSNFQPRRSITNAAGGEMGEIHVSCHSAIYDGVGDNLPSPLPQQQQSAAASGGNGRKVSPLGRDHHQHAVVKERVGDTAVTTFSTRVLAPDMIKVPLTPTVCVSNGSSWDASSSSCGPRRCPNFISVQSIQESFQKFADFCSTAFNAADSSGKSGDARRHLMPYHGGVHKFSLEQRSNLVESEAALAKRATKSLPSTARPPIEYFQIGEQHLLAKLKPKLSIPLEDAEGGDQCDDNGGVATVSTTRSTTSSSDTLISTKKEHTEEIEGLGCGSDTATPSAVSVESSSPGPPKSFFEMLGGGLEGDGNKFYTCVFGRRNRETRGTSLLNRSCPADTPSLHSCFPHHTTHHIKPGNIGEV